MGYKIVILKNFFFFSFFPGWTYAIRFAKDNWVKIENSTL